MSNLMLSLGYMPFVGIDWTVVAQLLNTLILFLILKKILFVKVKTMIDERQAEVDRIYADAEAAQAQASLLKEHYDQSLAGARDEAQRIVIEARKNAENQAEAILADARTEVTALRERADADIAGHDGLLNGWVLSPQGKAILLTAVDGNNRPLFINSAAEGAVPMILGAPVRQSKGAYTAETASADALVGIAGDWTQAVYGTVEGVQIAISDQATLTDGGSTINLFEQNMFAVRAEIEVGFRCDTTVFNKLTGKTKTGG